MSLLDGILTLAQLELSNERVLMRVDFNVPLDGEVIGDDARIREALPTIKAAMDAGAKVILASHLGRPKPGKHEGLSLEPIGSRLAELLNAEVHMPDDCVGDSAKKVIYDLRGGQVCLLENLRFHPEEEANDEVFAQKLRNLADVYVSDAFGACHRAHASVHAAAKLFHRRGCGLLMEKEISALGRLLVTPEKPFVALLGGAKVSDKIEVISALLRKVDALLVGGAMANTFLAAAGHALQNSKIEADKLPLARTILEQAKAAGVRLLLPTDLRVATSLDAQSPQVVPVDGVPAGHMALDIGPATAARYAAEIAAAKTVFWNGPMGLFERRPFADGTFTVGQAMADAAAFTVVGGGDSAAAVKAAGGDMASKMSHISTGGGAALELIEGKKLPGIEVLRGGV
jgi:phosphoglycerate kinase